MGYYQALGLETRLSLDADDLQKRFYALSRQWHPDKFSRGSASEQQKALETTALLNDAFRTLRNPISRAEYVLGEHKIAPSKTAPPELLEEVFELNVALEEMRGGDASVRPQLEQARENFTRMLDEMDHSLIHLFDRYDQSRHESQLLAIRAVLDRRRYVSNLLRDVDKELNVNLSN